MWTVICRRKFGLGRSTPRALGITPDSDRFFDTRAAMLWDDQNLYVGFWLEDRDMWGTQKEASPLVRQDNNAGVLLVGRGAYYELAVNPLGATSEMFYIWKEAYQRGGRYDVPEFDLAVHRPEVLGGGSNSDYRAMRWAFSHWRFPGRAGRRAGRGYPEQTG